MYVIGRNDFDFIKVTNSETFYDGRSIWSKVREVEYNSPLSKATIIPDYEVAEKLIKEVQDNVGNISFRNNSIIGEILDREASFDKVVYSSELKIFELVPTAVSM